MGGGKSDREMDFGLWREPEFKYVTDEKVVEVDSEKDIPEASTVNNVRVESESTIAVTTTEKTEQTTESTGTKTGSVKADAMATEGTQAADTSADSTPAASSSVSVSAKTAKVTK